MPEVTLSSKNQITIPVAMVRALGLKAGDELNIIQVGDHLALFPTPANWVDYFRGSLKGVYGSTKEEIDRYIAEERASWDRSRDSQQWLEEIEDLLESDPEAKRIVEELRRRPGCKAPASMPWEIEGIDRARVEEAVSKLVKIGAVRKIPPPPGVRAYQHVLRLVREVASLS